MTGVWMHWPRLFWLLGVLVVLVLALAGIAVYGARQQAVTTAQSQQGKPPDLTGDKPPADLVASVQRPLVLKREVEPVNVVMTNGVPDESLQKQINELKQQRQKDQEEMQKLRDELARKPQLAKTADPNAAQRAQEAKEAAKQREAAVKARRNSPMAFFEEDDDRKDKDKSIGKRERPPYPYFASAGSIVTCVLENGINTEHPAPVIARITAPVYDRVTGIEAEGLQDAVLMGEYKPVLLGDETVTVTWTKLVHHDGSETPLDGQPGGDALGRAGLPADIDNKWGTSMLAMLTRSVQQASTIGVSMVGNSTAERAAAAAATGAIQESGQKVTRTMNVSPTGYVAPGTPCSMTLKTALDLTPAVRP